MTAVASGRPRLLLVGGAGGLVGRSLLPALRPTYSIRSVHRAPAPNEAPPVEWVRADAQADVDWVTLLREVDVVVNVAWYRWTAPDVFRSLSAGLIRLIEAARSLHVARFIQISVPAAPAHLEAGLPYLTYKRAVDQALASSDLSYRIIRPTMLFGPGDVLLGVMMRLMRRYPRFPMFGDGEYHVSPVSVADLAQVVAQEASGSTSGVLDLGGPERFRYRDLTDRMFHLLGKRPRYWSMSASSARRLTRLMVAVGSTLLYPYEVDWLVSDMLGLPAYTGLGRPLQRVDPYLEQLANPAGARREA